MLDNDWDSNSFGFEANLGLHENVSLGLSLGHGGFESDPFVVSYGGILGSEIRESSQVAGGVELIFHKKFNSSSTVTFDPFAKVATGVIGVDGEGTFTPAALYGLQPVTTKYKLTLIPIQVMLGAEVVFNEFFILTPEIGFMNYIYDDDSTASSDFLWSISGDLLMSEHIALGLMFSGTGSDTRFGLNTKFIF